MDEYISKEEIVTKIRSSVSVAENEWEIGYNTAMAEMMQWIKHIPAADVEPVRHGHWTNGNCGDYVCSVCGWAFSDELPYMAREYDAETEEIMRYCMHCGARLELQGGEEMDIYEEIKKIKEENAALRAKVEELTEKHWEECRQIALYDDELREAQGKCERQCGLKSAVRGKI